MYYFIMLYLLGVLIAMEAIILCLRHIEGIEPRDYSSYYKSKIFYEEDPDSLWGCILIGSGLFPFLILVMLFRLFGKHILPLLVKELF